MRVIRANLSGTNVVTVQAWDQSDIGSGCTDAKQVRYILPRLYVLFRDAGGNAVATGCTDGNGKLSVVLDDGVYNVTTIDPRYGSTNGGNNEAIITNVVSPAPPNYQIQLLLTTRPGTTTSSCLGPPAAGSCSGSKSLLMSQHASSIMPVSLQDATTNTTNTVTNIINTIQTKLANVPKWVLYAAGGVGVLLVVMWMTGGKRR